ncbi:MAG: YybH family protein [Caulobacter sp.]
MDIADYNARWLAAWTAKDVPALLGFYAEDCSYMDNNTAAGITGHAALKPYLEGLFTATPPMTYEPEAVWAIEGGFCGRWYCTIAMPDGSTSRMRGFDLVILDGDRITHNEVYVHPLP